MMKNLYVGIYCFGHDSNFSIFDITNNTFQYCKLERMNGIKHYDSNSAKEWAIYLEDMGYNTNQIIEICIVQAAGGFPWFNEVDDKKILEEMFYPIKVNLIGHHTAHQLSTFCENGLVYDGEGSDNESLTIVNDKKESLKFCNINHLSMGGLYMNEYFNVDNYYDTTLKKMGWKERHQVACDFAGKVMAWEAFGLRSSEWQERFRDTPLRNFNYKQGYDLFEARHQDDFHMRASFIKNVTEKYANDLIKHLKDFFEFNTHFTYSGGTAQNLILNNYFKSNFPNIQIVPHCNDDGLSIGALYYLLKKQGLEKEFKINNFPFCQSDEDMNFASIGTIKKVAEHLANGKIVFWGQGHGEIGPRALGHRSILMNPAIKDAKDQINNKIKKREWYRPYGASVLVDDYKEHFEIAWESPYMNYQANVKNKEDFTSICHVDGTSRIQTVNQNQESFYELLQEFKKLTGFSILLNTSCNLPGSPIVGSTDQITNMFKKCHADCLVIGDQVYERKQND